LREQIYKLLKLQEIDREILNEEKKQKRLPAQINKAKEVITNIEKSYQEKKEVLKEIQIKARRKEIDASTIESKIKKHQDELYGGKISDIKELKQLQRVIESLNKDRDNVEEELLVIMDKEDEVKNEITEIEKELSKAKELLKQKSSKVSRQQELIQAKIQEKKKKRAEITDRIKDNKLMKQYELLWKDKDGQVVVEIDGITCSGCNLSLPSDIIYHLQKKDDLLITCPNCNRILIWKE